MRLSILALVIFNALPLTVYGQSRAGHGIPIVPVRHDPPPHFTIAPRGSLLPRPVLPLPGLARRRLQPAGKGAPHRRHGSGLPTRC
jgi:hypothetical protein